MTAAERIASALLETRAKVTPNLVAAIATAGSAQEVAAVFHAYAAERTTTALQKRELERALRAEGWSRHAAKAEAGHRVANQSQGDTHMNTTEQIAERIAALLHMTRASSWTSDHSLKLSAAMKGQPPEVLAMALLQFSQGLLRASRQVIALQIDCANGEIARDEGGLQ